MQNQWVTNATYQLQNFSFYFAFYTVSFSHLRSFTFHILHDMRTLWSLYTDVKSKHKLFTSLGFFCKCDFNQKQQATCRLI